MKMSKKQMGGIGALVLIVVAVALVLTVFRQNVGLEGFQGGMGYNASDKGFYLGNNITLKSPSSTLNPDTEMYGFTKGFNSGIVCRNLDRTYLTSSDGLTIGEGTASRVFTGGYLTVHVISNLPDSQATFEYTRRDRCDCHCNGNFDCYCGTGSGQCPYFMAWLVDENSGHRIPIGKMKRFRDGYYRVERMFNKGVASDVASHNKILITFEGNARGDVKDSFDVVYGYFNNRGFMCR